MGLQKYKKKRTFRKQLDEVTAPPATKELRSATENLGVPSLLQSWQQEVSGLLARGVATQLTVKTAAEMTSLAWLLAWLLASWATVIRSPSSTAGP